MAIKITLGAKIDGDQFVRALQLPGMRGADIGLKYEISFQGNVFTCETPEDVLVVLKALVPPSPDPTTEPK